MRRACDDAGARWIRFLEGLDEAHRRLALAAVDPRDWRRLGVRIVKGADSLAAAAASVDVAPDPERWSRALQVGQDALEYLRTLEGWVRIPGDLAWPPGLDCGDEPVAVLAGRGTIPTGRAIAIVGTRGSSEEGDALSGELAAAWVECGGWVVSGGALGIDAAAHRGALAAGGRTLVVAGTGLGAPYPRGHRALFRRIERDGAVVSEYAPTFPGSRWSFLERNRIIAGFAEAVVVVEAPPRSGALSTARFALKCGKKVLTVPGNSGRLRSEGALLLLSEGALPLRGPEDLPVFFEVRNLQDRTPSEKRPPMNPAQRRVLEVLAAGGNGRHLDVIGREAVLEPGILSVALLELELEGRIMALGEGRFRLSPGECYRSRGAGTRWASR